MLKSAVICTGLFTAVAETSTPFTPLSTTTPSPGVEEYLPTKMPMPTPPTDDHDDGYDEYGVMTMIYHLLHHASGGRMKEEAPVITDVLPGDFFDTRKTSKLGVYSGEFKLDEYGSVATDVTVYAKTSDNNVNKDDFRYLTIDVQGGTFGHWFGYYPTVKIYNGMGNAYISAYYFKPIPFEPRMSNDSNPDAMVKTTSTPEHYDGDDHDYHRVTLTAKARAEVYLPWDQTAVPCFGSAGADGAWYLIHQFNDERLHCVVFDDHKAWYSASHPKRRDPVWITSGDVILAIRKRSGYMRGYRVKSLAHGLPYIIQWRGVQRGMQSTTANIEEGCGGFCIFGDYSQMYTVDDTYRVEDSTIELSFDHSVLTTTTPYPTTLALPLKAPLNQLLLKAPLALPLKAPLNQLLLKAPLALPLKAPLNQLLLKAPLALPLKAPLALPLKAPLALPLKAPLALPPKAPLAPPLKAPLAPPLKALLKQLFFLRVSSLHLLLDSNSLDDPSCIYLLLIDMLVDIDMKLSDFHEWIDEFNKSCRV
ncbi:hypothetical protein FOL47_008007 [Perkinsus chesapeaki]|uniref:Uncharacterized protein n=1 Tax=Perkinsus chesapeaki TaxID=330153 RepID=A0A7J6LGE6_PERCH|nr:hypothetical protein FOL47_008007 [Perkinsus chesapeaki]